MDSTCPTSAEGLEAIQWINNIFGECVYGWQECVSLMFGYLSILAWLNAQMPQVIKNYRLGTAESLSFTFLVVWLIGKSHLNQRSIHLLTHSVGDVANLIGCTILGQLPFQLYLSIYFITIDTFLCIQWIYYVKYPTNALRQWFNPGKCLDKAETPASTETTCLLSEPSQKSYSAAGSSSKATVLLMIGLFTLNAGFSQSLTTATDAADHIVAQQTEQNTIWIGRFFAWLCTFFYLSSRLPQIIQNFRRRSVQGLSMALFFFAAMGNLTYCLSIFTNPHATRQSIIESVPYILGSAGTLMFDGTIYAQYMIFDSQEKETDSEA
ncbi:PQ loop repeat-domain-containing protein [Phycomyces nitens]|nr:PQ loop repeat-domain-containing protein [Phycomyces nitens]